MGSWWLVLFLERYGHTVYKTICPFSREVETCSSVSGKRFKLLSVDNQIWHLLRSTGQTGLVCTVRVELGFL